MDIKINYSSDFSHLNILKIGAYKGDCSNDILHGKLTDKMAIIFVEPVERYITALKSYHGREIPMNKYIYINKAVYSTEGKLKINFPSITNDWSKLPQWLEQCASVRPTHITDHGFKDIDLDTAIVPCTTISKILEDYFIRSIDYLCIDTEGCDYDILTNYDFKIKPKFLSFENLHMDGYKTRGIKYQALLEYLKYHGYEIIEENDMDTFMRLVQV